MQKITPFLWFDNEAEEAMNFYVSIFKNSKVLSVNRYGDNGPGSKSTVMHCETQAEVDEYWAKLSAGGKENQCAWLEDKFGVSWQIVPTILIELLSHPDSVKAGRVMEAMMQMTKIDIAALKHAYEQ